MPPARPIMLQKKLVLVGLVSLLVVVRARSAEDGLTREELLRLSAEIGAEVAELRDAELRRPVKAETMGKEGLVRFARDEMARTTPPEVLAAQELIAKLLGIAPVDLDLEASLLAVLEEQAGGFYDPRSETFYLIEGFGGDLARIILAHELTHALDDQLYDLESSFEERQGNDDASFAYKALAEGSGVVVMNQWMLDHFDELSLDALQDGGGLETEVLESMPAFLWKPLMAEYLKGAAFLHRTESVMRGQLGMPPLADLEAAFSDPPASSEQILHPRKYWGEPRDTPLDVVLEIGSLSEGWEPLHENTFGELGLALCTAPPADRGGFPGQEAMLEVRYTNPAAEGWGGDRYVLLGRGDARVLHAVTVWDTPAEAAEFATALSGASDGIEARARELAGSVAGDGAGARVTRAKGSDEVVVTVWLGAGEDEVGRVVAAVESRVDGR